VHAIVRQIAAYLPLRLLRLRQPVRLFVGSERRSPKMLRSPSTSISLLSANGQTAVVSHAKLEQQTSVRALQVPYEHSR
jgi:hypothetical protein